MDFQKEEPFGSIKIGNRGDLRSEMMDRQRQNSGDTASDWSTNSFGDFKSVLSYCIFILGGPVVAFFVTRFGILSGMLEWDASAIRTEVTSAIVAVVVLHIALGLFIVRAYFSGEDKSKAKIGKSD